jgi:hypothetical protein
VDKINVQFITMTTFLNTQHFIGPDNPSLIDLISFTSLHKEYFNALDLTVLQEYYSNTVDKVSDGKYYLHGYLPLFPDTPITHQIIDDAKNIHVQRNMHYGTVCKPLESVFINDSINNYNNLIIIIDLYQTIVSDTNTEIYKKNKESFFEPCIQK